ncbi:MAG: helix-turn-helix domain-containing protein, partial [Candidatus Hermodarchaeota archaeon]
TCEEIQEILQKKELETIKYELKSSKILEEDGWKEKVAQELVAFANRNGGKLIIGLQNDGTYDGKADYDVDKLKGDIQNIIRDKISPRLEYNFQFLQCKEGDLSVITVEKKIDIPYAYITKRKTHEIKNRIYYVRTPHGKSLVSDKQLQFLFNEKKLNLNHPFTIAIVFDRDSLVIPYKIKLAPRIQIDFMMLYNKLYDQHKKEIGNRWNDFVEELVLYHMVYTIIRHFDLTWDIEPIESTESLKMYLDTPKESFKFKDLLKPDKDSIFSSLSIRLDEMLEESFIQDTYLPPNTKFEISKNRFRMFNEQYSFTIYITRFTWSTGLFGSHPQAGKYLGRSSEEYQKIFEKFGNVKIQFFFEAALNFPEPELEYFESYIRLINTFRKIIDRDWNHDEFVKTLPNYMFFNLEGRLERIENILKEKSEK